MLIDKLLIIGLVLLYVTFLRFLNAHFTTKYILTYEKLLAISGVPQGSLFAIFINDIVDVFAKRI